MTQPPPAPPDITPRPTPPPVHYCGHCGNTIREKADRCDFGCERVGMGIGSHLTLLIPKYFKSSMCGCEEYAAELDRHDAAWGREHFDEVVAELVARSQGFKMLFPVPNMVRSQVATYWLEEAVSAVEEQEHNPIPQFVDSPSLCWMRVHSIPLPFNPPA